MPDVFLHRASRTSHVRMDASGRPSSLDEAGRSVLVVASTEEPATVFDWDAWQPVREVLLMSGCQLPPGGQVPLLDAHSRESVGDVIGSFRNMSVEQGPHGPQLVGRCVFSATADGEAPWQKVCEGHVTDVSIGYEVVASMEIRSGENAEVEGRVLEGPLRVATSWRLFELSLCPIGADQKAKVRASRTADAVRRKTFTRPAPRAGEERAMSKKQRESAPQGQEEQDEGLRALLRKMLRALRGDDDAGEEKREEAPDLKEEREIPEGADVLEDPEIQALVEEILETVAEEDLPDGENGDPDEEGRSVQRKKNTRAAAMALAARADRDPALRARLSVRMERGRISGIRELCRAHGLDARQEEDLINAGVSLTAAKARVYDMIRSRSGQAGPGFQVAMGASEQEKVRAAAQDSLFLRAGLQVEKPAPGADEMRSYSLRELAREMVARSGGSTRGDIRQIVGRALTTTDLPLLMVETSRRALMEGYEAAPETWSAWAGTGTATDFKDSTAIGFEGEVELKKIPEYGEYTEGRLAENAEKYRVETFGRKLTISRQSIINDDLGALTEIPRMYGEACARLVGDVAYAALLDTKLKMGDGKPLFHADHRNLFSGQGGVPDVEKLGAVVKGMKLQKDRFGQPITIQPAFFLGGVGMETACESFFNTQINGDAVVGTQAQPLIHNPFGGGYFVRVYDRRMDDMAANAWILAARRGTVNVYFLGGVQSPYIENNDNFDTDGFESKVRMDVGAKALRWVTLAKAVQ